MPAMRLFRLLFRILMLAVGALIGLGLFLFAVLAFIVFLLASLLTGRKPNLQFRASKNPWASRQAPAGDVVDVEAREVPEQAPLPLQPPKRG
jgi:Flp pilus assembly protein protease CpaA